MDGTDLCGRFTNLVWPYLDGELSQDERGRWDVHLESCPACRKELSTAESIRVAYAQLPDHDVQETTVQAVLDGSRQMRVPVHRRLRLWRPAAAVLTLAASIVLYLNLSDTDDGSPRWDPPQLEAAVARLDSTRASLRNELFLSDREDQAPSEGWEQRSLSLQERIASLKHEIATNGS